MSNIELTFNVDPSNLGELVEKHTLMDNYESIDQLTLTLHSHKTNGLSSDERIIKIHRDYFGSNFIPPKMPKTIIEYILEPLKDKMLLFILIGGVVTLITELIKDTSRYGADGISIILVVILIVGVTAFTDYSKEVQIKNLQKSIKNSNSCSVVRSGAVTEIKTADLVVGDLYIAKYGDLVPADGIVVSGSDLKIDESAITGESGLIKKDPQKNPYLLAGTHVIDGTGIVLIVAVGYNSETGRILKLMGVVKKSKEKSQADETDKINTKGRSVLQEKLNKLAFYLGIIGLIAGIVVIIIHFVRFSIKQYGPGTTTPFKWADLLSYLNFVIEGFCVLVVAIPEGLPLSVTLSLAYSMRRMMKDKNLVRDMHSCETMGNATTICSDKTGTLTTNRMTVVRTIVAQTLMSDFSIVKSFSENLKNSICLNICVNKNPSSFVEPSKLAGLLPRQFGNKTDCALLGFLSHFDITFNDFMSNIDPVRILKIFPFNSNKKMMSAIFVEDSNTLRVLIKGAPDVLLPLCHFYYDFEGNINELQANDREILGDHLMQLAEQSLRTILLAEKFISVHEYQEDMNEATLISNLNLVCIAGIEDPVRPDVPEAIQKCVRAGITVRMVTGDNIITARSIAVKCGILGINPDETIMDSTTFNKAIAGKDGKIDQTAFDMVWPKLRVLARSSPKDKYTLVDGILSTHLPNKQIVAVTGDGTNDAPALKRADVGFAMGVTGTDIAKEASDIILTDDNFSSIVKAILWGRNVYDSISKFIQFQLTVNVGTVIISIISTIYGSKHFLTAPQLLWLNIIMDSFASLALATSPPNDSLLLRKPYSRTRGLLSKNMVIFVLLHALYQVFIVLILVFFAPQMFGVKPGFDKSYNEIAQNKSLDVPTIHGTIVFNTFVLMQLFNEINARMIHGERNVFSNFLTNKLFLIIMIISFGFQAVIVSFTGRLFFVERLNLAQWGWCVLFGVSELLYHQIFVVTLSQLITIPKRFRIDKGFERDTISAESQIIAVRLRWIRGVRKLQQELRVIRAFRENLVIRRDHLGASSVLSFNQSLHQSDIVRINDPVT